MFSTSFAYLYVRFLQERRSSPSPSLSPISSNICHFLSPFSLLFCVSPRAIALLSLQRPSMSNSAEEEDSDVSPKGVKQGLLDREEEEEDSSKVIYVLRHAQSTYNEAMESWTTWCTCRCHRELRGHRDASLSETGQAQVKRLKEEFAHKGVMNDVQVILVSPLTRALETAVGVFGTSQVPIVVLPELAERAKHNHDLGTSKRTLENKWGQLGVDFSAVAEEDWWYQGAGQESAQSLWDRVAWTKRELANRPEKVIVIVGHSNFLYALQGKKAKGHLKNCQWLKLSLKDMQPGKRPPLRSAVFEWLPI
eukprot:g38549.t1